MPLPDQREKSPSPLDEVMKKIGRLYDGDALEAANVISNTELCIITAPHSFGKSRLLTPRIERVLQLRGYNTLFMSTDDGESGWINERLAKLPQVENGILFFDRAYKISRQGNGLENTRNVVKTLRQRGLRIIPLVAHSVDDIETRDTEMHTWMAAATGLINTEPQAVHFPQKRLPVDLAVEYVNALNTRAIACRDRKVIDYILEVVPPYLRPLETLVDNFGDSYYSVQSAILYLRNDLRKIIPKDEVESMIKRVALDYYGTETAEKFFR